METRAQGFGKHIQPHADVFQIKQASKQANISATQLTSSMKALGA
ncbi:hypothetical protein [Nitrosomonas sp. Nm132]|nr:hypothetical protein [Nitrosomonas sp. Nm132]